MASRGERRREDRNTGGSEMSKFYWILGAVAVIGVVAVGYSVGSSALGTATTEPIEVEGLDDMATLVDMAQGITKGDPDAPITIVEFADYQCPGCGGFALQVKPQIELSYVQTGKAKFVYYDFPLIQIHAHAFLAARAGRCANDQDLFWQFQDEAFRNQGSWPLEANPAGSFADYAEEVGADKGMFEECLNSDRHADVVTANLRLAEQLNLPGTPAILINKGNGMARRLQQTTYQAIQNVVEDLLAEDAPVGN